MFAANPALAEQETEKKVPETENKSRADDVTVSIENDTSGNAQEMASESKLEFNSQKHSVFFSFSYKLSLLYLLS